MLSFFVPKIKGVSLRLSKQLSGLGVKITTNDAISFNKDFETQCSLEKDSLSSLVFLARISLTCSISSLVEKKGLLSILILLAFHS